MFGNHVWYIQAHNTELSCFFKILDVSWGILAVVIAKASFSNTETLLSRLHDTTVTS